MNSEEAKEAPGAQESDEQRMVTRRSLLKLGWVAPVVMVVPLTGFTGFHGGNVSAGSASDGSGYGSRSGGSNDSGSLIQRILNWLMDLFKKSKDGKRKRKRWGWS